MTTKCVLMAINALPFPANVPRQFVAATKRREIFSNTKCRNVYEANICAEVIDWQRPISFAHNPARI